MMKTKKLRFVPYRRKLDGRTNYRKRLKLLVSGTPRLIVRKTNKHTIVQIALYSDKGDRVIVTASSAVLKRLGWNHATGNLPAAYLTGLIAAKAALQKKVDNAIVDLGLQTPTHGSRVYAAIKGAIDAGLKIPCSEDALPSSERISGKHIADYKKSDIQKNFEDVKAAILKK